jgi:hypothetical protein
MSFAGIVYQTEDRDARSLARKIEPLAKFFHDAEIQVRTMSTPPSLSTAQGQYVDAMALYANAAAEMLKFTKDSDSRHLRDAHRMNIGPQRTCCASASALAGTVQAALGPDRIEGGQAQFNLNHATSISSEGEGQW